MVSRYTKQEITREVSDVNYEIFVNDVDLRHDLETLIERNSETKGREIYIENSRNEYKEQNVWEQNNIVDAYPDEERNCRDISRAKIIQYR